MSGGGRGRAKDRKSIAILWPLQLKVDKMFWVGWVAALIVPESGLRYRGSIEMLVILGANCHSVVRCNFAKV